MKRKGMSKRKRTNKKKKCVWKKVHKIQNFHHFAIYRLPDLDISDEEEVTESEDEDLTDEDSSEEASSEEETSSSEEETFSTEEEIFLKLQKNRFLT